ncbi:MAG: hypothetical protein AAGI44_01050 [Pseudomonadota bacterium]
MSTHLTPQRLKSEFDSFEPDRLMDIAWTEARTTRPHLDDEKQQRFVERYFRLYETWWVSIQEESPILQDLTRKARLPLKTLSDLPSSLDNNISAAKVSLSHLKRDYSRFTYEKMIPRLASLKTSRAEIADGLLILFESGNFEKEVMDRIAFTLQEMVGKSHIESLTSAITNDQLGPSRAILMKVYAKIAREAATPVLASVIDQPMMVAETLPALGFTRDGNAIPCVESYLEHKDSERRRDARQSLKRLEKYRLE